MKIRVWIIWHIIVDDNIDALDIDTSAEYVSRDHYTVFEVLKRLVVFNST